MVPLAPEGIAEPPSSVSISDQLAIRRTTESAAPARQVDSNEEYPAVIELKSGSVYTATSYWVSGNTFHFITTTRFDHFQVPLALLEHVYPRRPSQASDAMLTAPPKESVAAHAGAARK
jgi:hypothetical protein